MRRIGADRRNDILMTAVVDEGHEHPGAARGGGRPPAFSARGVPHAVVGDLGRSARRPLRGVTRMSHRPTRSPWRPPLGFQPPDGDDGHQVKPQSYDENLGFERPTDECADDQSSKDDGRGITDQSHQIFSALRRQWGLLACALHPPPC